MSERETRRPLNFIELILALEQALEQHPGLFAGGTLKAEVTRAANWARQVMR